MTSPQPDPANHPTPTGRWQRRIDTGWRATPVGLVLLPAGRVDPVTVAGSAVAVWRLLAQPITRADLIVQLATSFGAYPATVQADLDPLLTRLLELEAVEITSSPMS